MISQEIQSTYLKKAKIACFVLQFTPFIRMVALNGSLARGEAKADSDIDFIIIAKTGRIWTCRAVSTLLMAILGWKRYANKIAGRVCLNLYQTTDHLKLTSQNAVLARNHAYTLPLWQSRDEFFKFMQANIWIYQFGKNYIFENYEPSKIQKICSNIILIIRKIFEILFDLILADWGEKMLKLYQTKRINRDIRTKQAQAGQIYISDQELRFHPTKN